MSFFEWLDNAGAVVWMRDSTSVFAYPTIIAFHTLSMAMLVGVSSGLALRTLGFAPGIPLAPLDRFFCLIWAGFYISVASGLPLLSTDAHSWRLPRRRCWPRARRPPDAAPRPESRSTVFVAIDGRVAGVAGLREDPHADAAGAQRGHGGNRVAADCRRDRVCSRKSMVPTVS